MTVIDAYNGAFAVLEDYSVSAGVPTWEVVTGFSEFYESAFRSALLAEMADASDDTSEQDFYAGLLDRGITPGIVMKYVSEDIGTHMKLVCENYGLI